MGRTPARWLTLAAVLAACGGERSPADGNRAPRVTIHVGPAFVGVPAVIDASQSSDPDASDAGTNLGGRIVAYTYTFKDQPTPLILRSGSSTATYVFAAVGNWDVCVAAEDGLGAVGSTCVTVAVTVMPPVDGGVADAGDGGLRDGSFADGGDGAVQDGGRDSGLADAGVLVAVRVTPPSATLAPGTTQGFMASGVFSDGTMSDLTASATWTSSNPGVVSVSGGRATALMPGSATITATAGGLAGTATITVPAARVVALAIVPPVATVDPGGRIGFRVDGTLSDGTHQDLTASVTWASSDTTRARVGADGVAIGVAGGTATISATFQGLAARAALTVRQAQVIALQVAPLDPSTGVGVLLRLHATAIFSDGSSADFTTMVGWSSSAPLVATVDALGQVSTRSPGTAVITATLPGLTGSTRVTVTAATVQSIAVSPASTTLSPGGTVRLTAVATFSDGTTTDVTASVAWSSVPAGVVGVSSGGVVTALAPGMVKVLAALGPATGVAVVTVSPATLVRLDIQPTPALVPVMAAVPVSAIGFFSDGSNRDVTSQVTWSTGSPAIATVNASGVITGVSPGNTTVIVTLSGVTASAQVFVPFATLSAITVTPANATTTVGLRTPYHATGRYSNGNMIDLSTVVTWATGNSTIATIALTGAQGELLARESGTTTVTASLGGITGQTNVTVGGATLVSIQIMPINPSVPLGQTVQFQAVAISSDGTTRFVTAVATWSSSDPTVATIMGAAARTLRVGTTTIRATFMGLTSSTTLTVTSAMPVMLQVTPVNPSVNVGSMVQFQATAIFSDGTSRDVTGMAAWQSSNQMVMQVVAGGPMRGRGTGLAPGQATISATALGLTGTTQVTVAGAMIVSISVNPAVLTLAVGSRRQYTAQAIFSNGTSMDVTNLATWQSRNPMIAQVTTGGGARGQVTAILAGGTQIFATYMGVTGSGSITVTNATLTSIQVTPPDPTIAPGTPLQLQATGLWSDGTTTNVTATATWLSANPMVAAVSDAAGSRGQVTTIAPGSAVISAIFMGVTGTTTVTVASTTITQIQIAPATQTAPVGVSFPLTATAVFSDGTTRNITGLATWTSSAPMVAAVSDAGGSKGQVTTIAGGTATITVQFMGATGTATVRVTTATLRSITVAPGFAILAVGGFQTFNATGTFSDGSMFNLTPLVTWTSSNPGAATISNAAGSQGRATGVGRGLANITALRNGVSGTAILFVQ